MTRLDTRHVAHLARLFNALAPVLSKGPTMPPITPLDRVRLDRGVEHLHRLGARATAEFLLELATTIGGQPAIMRLLAEYQNRLSPELLRGAGGHRMLSHRPRAIPAEMGRAAQ